MFGVAALGAITLLRGGGKPPREAGRAILARPPPRPPLGPPSCGGARAPGNISAVGVRFFADGESMTGFVTLPPPRAGPDAGGSLPDTGRCIIAIWA